MSSFEQAHKVRLLCAVLLVFVLCFFLCSRGGETYGDSLDRLHNTFAEHVSDVEALNEHIAAIEQLHQLYLTKGRKGKVNIKLRNKRMKKRRCKICVCEQLRCEPCVSHKIFRKTLDIIQPLDEDVYWDLDSKLYGQTVKYAAHMSSLFLFFPLCFRLLALLCHFFLILSLLIRSFGLNFPQHPITYMKTAYPLTPSPLFSLLESVRFMFYSIYGSQII